jgi:beta-glucanase (GH16 family)
MMTMTTSGPISRRRAALLAAAACLGMVLPAADAPAKPYRGAEYRTREAFTYGRFEVRMRSAAVSGMLASFFTYHEISSLAEWNEIDIENMGRYTNEVQFNTITPNQVNHVQRQIVKTNPHAGFHDYYIEWTPDYVAWGFDGYEVHRQTGDHIATLRRAQKLMMNIWQPIYVDWAGPFNRNSLPVYAYYDWVRYSSYTPGAGDNFTFQWQDDLNGYDAARWDMGTHSWDGNNCQFVRENIVFQDGHMILCMTDSAHSGYSGGPVPASDAQPPYIVSARASEGRVRVSMSEPLDEASAETASNFSGSVTVNSATLLGDGRTIELAVSGMNLGSPFILFVNNLKDRAQPPNTMALQYTRVAMPLAFPIRINVGGPPAGEYLADSTWSAAKEYGVTGGTIVPAGASVGGTADPAVFADGCEGLVDYHVRLPGGRYDVTLMFAETEHTQAGQRIFSVRAEGTDVLSNLDLFATAGSNTAVEQTIEDVEVNDGTLDLFFSATADQPIIHGLRIEGPTTGVGELLQSPEEEVLTVYPNPFNGEAVCRYQIHEEGWTTLRVYDLLGREVATLVDGEQMPGVYDAPFASRELSSGLYVLALRTAGHTVVNTAMLLR